jgi:hypothetical protein
MGGKIRTSDHDVTSGARFHHATWVEGSRD